uniref:Uncharacterized protein n=1 Tax=Ditylenchus dipsaci TaxID=166011 RepID=A0A915EFQ3_9BILA
METSQNDAYLDLYSLGLHQSYLLELRKGSPEKNLGRASWQKRPFKQNLGRRLEISEVVPPANDECTAWHFQRLQLKNNRQLQEVVSQDFYYGTTIKNIIVCVGRDQLLQGAKGKEVAKTISRALSFLEKDKCRDVYVLIPPYVPTKEEEWMKLKDTMTGWKSREGEHILTPSWSKKENCQNLFNEDGTPNSVAIKAVSELLLKHKARLEPKNVKPVAPSQKPPITSLPLLLLPPPPPPPLPATQSPLDILVPPPPPPMPASSSQRLQKSQSSKGFLKKTT